MFVCFFLLCFVSLCLFRAKKKKVSMLVSHFVMSLTVIFGSVYYSVVFLLFVSFFFVCLHLPVFCLFVFQGSGSSYALPPLPSLQQVTDMR